jgi:1,4-alpha-glucan branching enzyme
MHSSDTGIWTLFIPGLSEFTVYKYRITPQNGDVIDKADPMVLPWRNAPDRFRGG